MKKYFTQMLTVCCAIVFGAFITTDALAQGSTCETAVAVTPGAYTADGPSDGVSEDPCSTGAGEFADWYSYTPTENGTITVSSCEGGADTQLQILEGTCGSLSCVLNIDDVCAVVPDGDLFAAELVDVAVLGGTTYYIEWDNQWETLGFDWSLSFTAASEPDCEGVPGGSATPGTPCDDLDPNTIGEVYQEDCSCAGGLVAPTNDACADAINVECGATVSGNTTLATADTSLGTCVTSLTTAPGLWYSVLGDGSDITASLCDASFDTKIGVFTGDCAELVCETGNDDFCGLASQAEFSSVAGQTYYIYVTGFGTNAGAFDLTVTCASTVEDCEGVIGGPALPGTPCDDLNPETEGETYQEDCSCAGGIIPVPNDECDSSIDLACEGSVNGTTVGAAVSEGLNTLCNDFTSSSAEDVWYSFEADGSSSYTVTVDTNAATSGSIMDAVIFVYSGACGDLTEIGCSDDNFAFGEFSGESITLDSLDAGTYYVRVFNWNDGGEEFTISLDCESGCADPFPAVDEESLNTTFLGDSYLLEWDAVEGQTGCQVQLRFADGATVARRIIPGEDANSAIVPGGALEFSTDYEWRVRCGCSEEPLVVGPVSSWQLFTTPGSAISSLPNPTEGQSNVTFTVMEEGYTTLEVFDMSGRLVDAIFMGNTQPNNEYRFEFDGSALPNGVYIYRLTTESEVLNEKFMIVK